MLSSFDQTLDQSETAPVIYKDYCLSRLLGMV
jgi:hypothetical protein